MVGGNNRVKLSLVVLWLELGLYKTQFLQEGCVAKGAFDNHASMFSLI